MRSVSRINRYYRYIGKLSRTKDELEKRALKKTVPFTPIVLSKPHEQLINQYKHRQETDHLLRKETQESRYYYPFMESTAPKIITFEKKMPESYYDEIFSAEYKPKQVVDDAEFYLKRSRAKDPFRSGGVSAGGPIAKYSVRESIFYEDWDSVSRLLTNARALNKLLELKFDPELEGTDQEAEELLTYQLSDAYHERQIPKRDFDGNLNYLEIQKLDYYRALDIQAISQRHMADFNSQHIGYKIGATNDVMMKKLGIEKPFYGPLFDRFHWHDDSNNDDFEHVFSISQLNIRGFEVELGYKIKRDNSDLMFPTYSGDDILRHHVDHVIPSIEICGSRFDQPMPFNYFLADFAGNAFVLSKDSPKKKELDKVHDIEIINKITGKVIKADSTQVLGNPMDSLASFFTQYTFSGHVMAKDSFIITGAMGGLQPVYPNDQYQIKFNTLDTVINIKFVA